MITRGPRRAPVQSERQRLSAATLCEAQPDAFDNLQPTPHATCSSLHGVCMSPRLCSAGCRLRPLTD